MTDVRTTVEEGAREENAAVLTLDEEVEVCAALLCAEEDMEGEPNYEKLGLIGRLVSPRRQSGGKPDTLSCIRRGGRRSHSKITRGERPIWGDCHWLVIQRSAVRSRLHTLLEEMRPE